jgi:hypothetical protein
MLSLEIWKSYNIFVLKIIFIKIYMYITCNKYLIENRSQICALKTVSCPERLPRSSNLGPCWPPFCPPRSSTSPTRRPLMRFFSFPIYPWSWAGIVSHAPALSLVAFVSRRRLRRRRLSPGERRRHSPGVCRALRSLRGAFTSTSTRYGILSIPFPGPGVDCFFSKFITRP